jgi:hypothetical protein
MIEPAPETCSKLPAVEPDAERLAPKAECTIGLHHYDENRLASKYEVIL